MASGGLGWSLVFEDSALLAALRRKLSVCESCCLSGAGRGHHLYQDHAPSYPRRRDTAVPPYPSARAEDILLWCPFSIQHCPPTQAVAFPPEQCSFPLAFLTATSWILGSWQTTCVPLWFPKARGCCSVLDHQNEISSVADTSSLEVPEVLYKDSFKMLFVFVRSLKKIGHLCACWVSPETCYRSLVPRLAVLHLRSKKCEIYPVKKQTAGSCNLWLSKLPRRGMICADNLRLFC